MTLADNRNPTLTSSILYLDGINVPDVSEVLANGSIGRELAHAGHVENGHFCPAGFVTKCLVYVRLAVYIRLEIGH